MRKVSLALTRYNTGPEDVLDPINAFRYCVGLPNPADIPISADLIPYTFFIRDLECAFR